MVADTVVRKRETLEYFLPRCNAYNDLRPYVKIIGRLLLFQGYDREEVRRNMKTVADMWKRRERLQSSELED